MAWVDCRNRFGVCAEFAILLMIVAGNAQPASSASIGINFQTDRAGYGPASIASEAPASAFGVAAGNWYETGVVPVGADTFSVHGGQVGISWSSFPDAAPGIAYGWTHANQEGIPSPPGDPASGEDALLSAFLFATGPDEAGYADGTPIVVSIDGLESVANLAAGYTVKLFASSEWTVDSFTDAEISDNAANSETIFFELLPDRPLWWTGPPWESTGAVGSSAVGAFTGDTLTIELVGFNELGTRDDRPYQRTSLAGVIVEFTPIPEPSSVAVLLTGVIGVVCAAGRTH